MIKYIMRFLLVLCVMPLGVLAQGKFFGGNGDGYHMATLNAVVLPIKIESFRVKQEDAKRRIELILAPGSTACTVTLERSQNLTSFQSIDSLENSNGLNNLRFNFEDPSLQKTDIYYRCKIEDCNGQTFYTLVNRIQHTEVNPSFYYSYTDRSIHYDLKEDMELLIVDALGRVLTKRKIVRGQGSLRLPPTLSGIYFLKFGQSSTMTIVL